MNKASNAIMNGVNAVEWMIADPGRGEEVVLEPGVPVVGDGVATGVAGL